MKQYFTLSLLSVSVLLAGCTTASLKELRRAEVSGDRFQAALAKEYLAFAESEAALYDWIDSKYFADKGLLAAYGNEVGPESLSHWKISKTVLPEMEMAREAVSAFVSTTKTSDPETAARAQFLFDCWAEQQEESWAENEIAACRDELKNILGAPSESAAPPVEIDEPVVDEPIADIPVVNDAPATEENEPASTTYIVFFDWNQDMLREDAAQVLDEVVKDVRSEPQEKYEIVLNGHADLSGDDNVNLELSERRVERVKQALVSSGIKEKYISTNAYGETEPRVKTADGVKEKANRRVEIFINE